MFFRFSIGSVSSKITPTDGLLFLHPQMSSTSALLEACKKREIPGDGNISPNSPNSFKIYQRWRRRIVDQANLWMYDVYPDFDCQDIENPPLDYHSNDIQRLDLFESRV
eukprot:TRINITY_DN5896_c0_g1_i2.p1 TRINITY_DN5896_c0_g1~~TRINITY_DN5896_c0_g1_i2.p1  ORF type:complete len:109 (-),score=18.08 TRINITY_DN5896_c0_g1_i2:404-730(-)